MTTHHEKELPPPEPTRRQLLARAIDARLREGSLMEVEEGPNAGEVLLMPFRSMEGMGRDVAPQIAGFRHEPVRLPRAVTEALLAPAPKPPKPSRAMVYRRTAEQERAQLERRRERNAFLSDPHNRRSRDAGLS